MQTEKEIIALQENEHQKVCRLRNGQMQKVLPISMLQKHALQTGTNLV